MKTTPEGLTHLVNMLVDVVNLQRKAQGTPGAYCEVELGLNDEGQATVSFYAQVDAAAPPLTTLSAVGGDGLSMRQIEGALQALRDIGYEDGAAREAVTAVMAGAKLEQPLSADNNRDSDEPAAG